MGECSIFKIILNLSTRWRRVVNLTLLSLYPRERATYQVNSSMYHILPSPIAGLGGFGEEIIYSFCRDSSPGPGIPELVIIPNTLPQLTN